MSKSISTFRRAPESTGDICICLSSLRCILSLIAGKLELVNAGFNVVVLWIVPLLSACVDFSKSWLQLTQPALLSIYERYYLPLGQRLKVCTEGLILAILPVIEEEDTEFFDKVYESD
jgi:Dopey, N-terminal